MPGFKDRDLYPLDGPALREARALMRGHTGVAVMGIVRDCGPCLQEAQLVKAELATIGISVRIDEFDNPWEAARDPRAGIDILDGGFGLDYADPAEFIRQILLEPTVSRWLPAGLLAEMRRMSRLDGPARVAAAANVADRLVEEDVALAADGNQVVTGFFSPRLGCRIFPPLGYGIDLAALCLNEED